MGMALCESCNKLLALRIRHGDKNLPNLVWHFDQKPVQCHVIDFEGAEILDEPPEHDLEIWIVGSQPWDLSYLKMNGEWSYTDVDSRLLGSDLGISYGPALNPRQTPHQAISLASREVSSTALCPVSH